MTPPPMPPGSFSVDRRSAPRRKRARRCTDVDPSTVDVTAPGGWGVKASVEGGRLAYVLVGLLLGLIAAAGVALKLGLCLGAK